ncbi:AAA family ATPase [Lasiodiplodia theobromae]|uniref:AAA family ATPase n=1 Tax=Lasiodiplodia theobromae TaxID=45133 RepID=UPI0015C2FFF7|nr:AAA family ATPase [Lasiodiplodia theobromae]KAF4541079.1 AAA family ATPase [Lasiodiplodia theobromae]
MAASASPANARTSRLSAFLHSVIKGKRAVTKARDATLLIEAICDQPDHTACVEKLVASDAASDSLRAGLRFDISDAFINNELQNLLSYLSDPLLKHLCNGDFLRRLLVLVVDPPSLWHAVVEAFKGNRLSPKTEQSFAWLLLELLSWNSNAPLNLQSVAQHAVASERFTKSDNGDLRSLGYRIKHVLHTKSVGSTPASSGPGGRHDNDFTDFRQIAIYPTEHELVSKERPFYRRADAVDEAPPDQRTGIHLDNQFRLLREDMLAELREDLKISQSKKGRRKNLRLRGLSLAGSHCGAERRRQAFAITVRCTSGLERLTEVPLSKRKSFLNEDKKFLKHQSFGCLMNNDQVVAFATLERVQDNLLRDPPIVTLRIPDTRALERALLTLKVSNKVDFVLINTAMFAYEPILECLQAKVELPLAEELLSLSEEAGTRCRSSRICPDDVADRIAEAGGQGLDDILSLPKPVNLDESQTKSLLSGLRQTVSLIQGPPGTGKSFIGALLAKALHDHTSQKILVICYTNHALDQFLEDLLDISIPDSSMVRLGAQSRPRTEHLSLFEQSSNYRRTQATWDVIHKLNDEVSSSETNLKALVASYVNFQLRKTEIMEYLEFSDDYSSFFDAFQLPEQADGFAIAGKDGSAVDETYLYDRWRKGEDPGVFKNRIASTHSEVWELSPDQRKALNEQWTQHLLEERVASISSLVEAFDASQKQLQTTLDQQKLEILRNKRIIACTTTAAAKYTQQLRNASPDIILVEEAGEILESHVLTAMTPETKQLILIGDHQQLRPKVNNYDLTVEKGNGYDLNRSLFERLILAGFPHTTLAQQHRMCPEISALVRHLTYPKLLDAPSTQNKPSLRGMQDRVVFFNHHHPEFSEDAIADRRDQGSGVSKKNHFEAEMVLQIVRYMAQQGYGTSDQVVLTPYLGQLSLLRRRLSEENDPVLNDLDSFDLVKAGLLSPATAKQNKRQIKISTIDNYQGEESDIVIVSLTRGNAAGDIGFMSSPERLNVLLSRARIGLIIIGNSQTFQQSRKGKATWGPFMDYLSKKGHIYEGLPVKCQQHPGKKMILKQKTDFDEHCPDGGCSAPCGATLNCGLHACPSRCHQLSDHSKIRCDVIMSDTCAQKHKRTWRCASGRPSFCRACDDEAREQAKKVQRDLDLEESRQAKQRAYARELAEIDDELDHERRLRRDMADQQERERVLRQRRRDLAELKQAGISGVASVNNASTPQTASQPKPSNSSPTPTSVPSSTSLPNRPAPRRDSHQQKGKGPWKLPESSAAQDWKDQKQFEGASNSALDDLMGMIGLENVKEQFLSIKGKIDVAVRQGLDMKNERFGAALLGNPGTGKTTVARLYAKFLSSVGALPGNFFVETTGSRLANDGVSGCKKHIEEIMNNGGGAMFIDEAYQLVSGTSAGGSQVLDFLLAEVENRTGKIVFILAGYNKQMEAFFAHNPGIPSRFPREMQFKDYEDEELLEILKYGLVKRYGGRMKVELGVDGLYARIVARRIGRGRGRDGFGNARAVENALAGITDRQAKRLRRERKSGIAADDLLLTQEDLLGPEPADVLKDNASWNKLQQLIGLSSVKDSVKALFDSIQYNYSRELDEEPLVDFTLNKVFLGNPGTGKTTVAKLYGQILADIGLLSSGEVVVKTPADFVGSVIGASEANTKGILAATVGKVLVIDEAYGLYGGNTGGAADPYKTAVIDTIVAEVQSVPGDDRCVLLLGYKEQMEEMFQNVNPGLTRRFPLDSAFTFEDFSDAELAAIFELKLKQQGFSATDQAKKAASDMLSRARNRPHFGNAGEIDIILNAAKLKHQQRISKGKQTASASFEPQDFDPDFDRGQKATTNVAKLFEGVVGCDDIVNQLKGYQTTAANMRELGLDPKEQIPFAFLFRGPPGTGKTSTARRMGKVYYDMGFLATAEVLECSVTDLVGEYLGQTGPKTQKLFEKALGKVLFIDEAYRLAEGHFAKEAMDEIVDCITKPRFAGRLVVILAGYDEDINRLMAVNPGLTSRFPETVSFRALRPEECLDLFAQTLLAKKKKGVDASGILDPPTPALREKLVGLFARLAALPNWASARDVGTLAKNVFGRVMRTGGPLPTARAARLVSESCVVEEMERMVQEREHRGLPLLQAAGPATMGPVPQAAGRDAPRHATGTDTAQKSAPPPPEEDEKAADAQPSSGTEARDAGVSDAVWEQLQRDKAKAEAEEREHRLLEERAAELEKEKKEQEARDREQAAKDEPDGGDSDDEREKAERERRRLEKIAAQRKRDEERAKIERKREERRVEAKKQECLRRIGVCPVGYRWIKQAVGWWLA